MIVVIDHYDSFTYNLVDMIGSMRHEVELVPYNDVDLMTFYKPTVSHIILSPGPGRPEHVKKTISIILALYNRLPILGVCLGHQAIGYAFGSKIIKLEEPTHGKVHEINHNGKDIFSGVESPLMATRYHSLTIDHDTLSPMFTKTAWTTDGVIMGIKHNVYPLYGVQFHPESIMTPAGKTIISNFVNG